MSVLRIFFLFFLLAGGLSACSSHLPPPKNINNVCSVFKQKNGWRENWYHLASKTEKKYGIPIPVLMATIRKESGFHNQARPARNKLMGLIPWNRPSSAYGYAQAVDGSWNDYRNAVGNRRAHRANFHDSIDFVGWYHFRSVKKFGISPHDMYNLHLAYHLGWRAYKARKINKHSHRFAHQTAKMAQKYRLQMQKCR